MKKDGHTIVRHATAWVCALVFAFSTIAVPYALDSAEEAAVGGKEERTLESKVPEFAAASQRSHALAVIGVVDALCVSRAAEDERAMRQFVADVLVPPPEVA